MPMDIIRLKPYQYVHVLDNNTNVTRVMVGPATYTRLDHEVVLHSAPQNCICVPPQSYCIVENPAQRDKDGKAVVDRHGQVKLRLGDQEIRFAQEPFFLFPNENLLQDVTPLEVLSPLQALRLKCLRNHEVDGDGGKKITRVAGDEWMVSGPCTYIPSVDVQVVSKINATIVRPQQAIRLRALVGFTDRSGVVRKAGEEWLHETPGAYIPSVEEDLVELVNAVVLTSRKAVHVAAVGNFTDRFGKKRQAGEKWLVTAAETETFIPTPNEKILCERELTTVGSRQYCVVQDYVDDKGKQRLGQKQLRKGLTSFFLHPGESLEGGKIKDIYVLGNDEALLLTANEKFVDEGGVNREAGDRWMLRGPLEYIPPVEVTVEERRRAIPLDVNEGVYIRDLRTGAVRAHIGKTVMLTENEELWEKPLEPLVEVLLQNPRLTSRRVQAKDEKPAPRQKSKVVTCNVPHNALVQVYDYKAKVARVVKGPELVMLMPDEQFTVLSLSGGKPKEADDIKSLCLNLGPDFMTDIIVVETSDHARLQLQVSYNWEFEQTPDIAARAFSVPDFVGDACKAIASRIRGFVASESFDSFHKNSSNIIRVAVFGQDKETKALRTTMRFPSNGLVITGIDIHSVDPVDPKTREALTKSVQLAIEITTKSQEATALHAASSQEQEAKGRLERQLIADKALAENERRQLLELEAQNAAVESTGASKAQSKAQAEAKLIEGETEVSLAAKKANAARIMAEIELELSRKKQLSELDHKEALYLAEIHKTREMAKIEAEKFKKVIAAVGKDTIKALARAGPELQAKLLKGLGLQGYLVTDGTNPINLFNTARGLTATATAPPPAASGA